MKKTMILAAVAATTFAACAAPLNPKATEADVRAVYAQACAIADAEASYRYANTNGLLQVALRKDLAALRAEIDNHYADLGQGGQWWHCAAYPRMSAIDRAARGLDAAFPKSLALAKRYGSDLYPIAFVDAGCSMDEAVECFGEAVAGCGLAGVGVKYIETNKRAVQKAATKQIRRWLRSQGKSFVSKNGVNPCEEHLSALTAALNAPRLAGLNKWLKDFGCAEIDLSKLPDAAAVNALKESVLYGDRKMDAAASATLYVCLGVDGYNAFVKEYNGD